MGLFRKWFGSFTGGAGQTWSADAATRGRWNVLDRSDLGFSIQYPEDWFVVYPGRGIDLLPEANPTAFDPDLSREVANPGVNVTPASVPPHLDNAVAGFVEILPDSYKETGKWFKFIKNHPLVTPKSAYCNCFEFNYPVGRMTFVGLALIVQKGKLFYDVTASVRSSHLPRWRSTLMNILDSFELED